MYQCRILLPRNHPKSPGQRRNPLTVSVGLTPLCIWQTSHVQKLLSGLQGRQKWCLERKCGVSNFRTVHWVMPTEQWNYSDIWWKGGELGQSCEVCSSCRCWKSWPQFSWWHGKCPHASCLDKWCSLWVRVLIHTKRKKEEQSWFGLSASGHGCNTFRKELIYY